MHNHHFDIGRRISRQIADNMVIFIYVHLAFVQLFPQHNRLRPFKMGQQGRRLIFPGFLCQSTVGFGNDRSCVPNSPAESAEAVAPGDRVFPVSACRYIAALIPFSPKN